MSSRPTPTRSRVPGWAAGWWPSGAAQSSRGVTSRGCDEGPAGLAPATRRTTCSRARTDSRSARRKARHRRGRSIHSPRHAACLDERRQQRGTGRRDLHAFRYGRLLRGARAADTGPRRRDARHVVDSIRTRSRRRRRSCGDISISWSGRRSADRAGRGNPPRPPLVPPASACERPRGRGNSSASPSTSCCRPATRTGARDSAHRLDPPSDGSTSCSARSASTAS